MIKISRLSAIVCIAVLTSGCTLVDAFLMRYDPNEYQQIADIRTTAHLSKLSCDNHDQAKQQSEIIAVKTLTFKQFTEFLPRNDRVKQAAVDLDQMAQGLKDQYAKSSKVSPAFCKIKFQTIENSAESMQRIIGDKPR